LPLLPVRGLPAPLALRVLALPGAAIGAGALSLVAVRRPWPHGGGGPGAGTVRHVPPAA